MQERQLCCPP